MANTIERNLNMATVVAPPKKKSKVGMIFKTGGVLLLLLILAILTVNAFLSMFKADYYITFGKYRLFSIVTDVMEPEIPSGSMIADIKPDTEQDIYVGVIITYKADFGKSKNLITHRVVDISVNDSGQTVYITKGDNASGIDKYCPVFNDIVGIYTGNKCGFFGSFFGFFQSSLGVSILIFCIFIILIVWIAVWYLNRTAIRRSLEIAALKKSAQALSTVNLRYDNIHEITAVMDVLGMVTDRPHTPAESRAIAARLTEFIKAENIELPQTPETAAILDTLPAPDTPDSLAAALSTGATLRQAEDGQTLVLTTMSGDKNILLTPVQTQDGVILCRQGVRLRAELAPNIEQLGALSMPGMPEFFEGQSLEKAVIYPELPQPTDKTFGPEMLTARGGASVQNIDVSSQPLPVPAKAKATGLPVAEADKNERPLLNTASHKAYAEYREQSAMTEIKQVEQLSSLLSEATPLTPEEQLKIAEYKAAHAKPKKPSAPRSPEQREQAKKAAERRKAEKQAFLDSLTPEDRGLYLAEQKLARTRASAIRKLKRIESDRKLLAKLDKSE